MKRSFDLARILLIAVGALAAISRASADESEIFHKPVRLQADGVDIDTGASDGHSGPCVADVDGDGLGDLVVGDFSGKFRFYKNLGSRAEPKYAACMLLKAGDNDAKVPIYCCIGSSPYFVDFDNDGKLDFISGSYDPGECYLFRGLGDGSFAARETLLDKTGRPILRHPDQRQNYESNGSWPVMVDWNNDGKLDVLVGGLDGTMFVRLNEGTREKPEFSTINVRVQAAGKELKLPGPQGRHAAPAVADWDGDGRWDILSGSESGAVFFYRNIGEPAVPRFDDPQILVAPYKGDGNNEVLDVGAEPAPGIRTQIAPVDYRGNGKTDLLVGDFCVSRTPRTDLTLAEQREFRSLRKQWQETIAELYERADELRRHFAKRFPGDAIKSDEARAEQSNAYRAMREPIERRLGELDAVMAQYLVEPLEEGKSGEHRAPHGYVWLFLRK